MSTSRISKQKRQDIQVLRAFSVAIVIAYHLPAAWNFEGGFVGVDIFFVISGYVVTQSLLSFDGQTFGEAQKYTTFIRKRISRLIPALSVALVAALLLAIQFAPSKLARTIPIGALNSQFFVSNFYFLSKYETYWNPEQLTNPLLHTWSLAVEFQIYLLLPFLFFVRPVNRAQLIFEDLRRKLFLRVLAPLIVSFILFVFLTSFSPKDTFGMNSKGLAFYLPITRLWEVLLGSIAVLILSRTKGNSLRTTRSLGIVGSVLILAGIVTSNQVGTITPAVALSCLGTAMVLHGNTSSKWAHSLGRNWTLPIWIGDRSYSIYLWHWPLLSFCLWRHPNNMGAILIALFCTVVISAISFRVVEKFNSPRPFGLRTFRYVVSFVFFCLAAQVVVSSHWYNKTIEISTSEIGLHNSILTGTQMVESISGCVASDLQIHCDNFADSKKIVILGDSLAYRTFPVVQFIAQQNGFDASMMWSGGCGIEINSCPGEFYEYLSNNEISGVIIAMNFDRPSSERNGEEFTAGRPPACASSTATIDCGSHLESVRTFETRASKGIPYFASITDHVLVSLPFPQQAYPFPACLEQRFDQSAVGLSPLLARCAFTSRAWQVSRQGLFPEAIRTVLRGQDKFALWNPLDYFCGDTWCPAFTEAGEMLMSDAIHWTLEASRFFFEPLNTFVSSIKN